MIGTRAAFRAARALVVLVLAAAIPAAAIASEPRASAAASAPSVLRVGSYHAIPGQFSDIQAAVDAAKPGDWILIGPGDHHEATTRKPAGAQGDDRAGAAVLIQTPGLWLRGMDRNGVWVDGTKPGAPRCSTATGDQDFGPLDSAGKTGGRNGILIYKAPNVIVENLSACNFVNGDQGGGNAIWWDGGASSGTQSSLGNWWGSYLTATSSYFKDNSSPSAGYGIYSSNTKPPGSGEFAHDYASNMNDSDYYVGACPDCSVTLSDVHAENSPQGYSGTNSGGHVLVENSEFDNNETGFATGDLNNDDQPSPQDGTCPGGARNPNAPAGIQRTNVCWTFINNYVHDNNNPSIPSQGVAGAAPVGTGMTIYGGRHDVFIHNRFVRNNAWGILFTPFPDTSQPPPIAHCGGGADLSTPASPFCYFDDWGSEFAANTFTDNGGYGNPTNGDIAEISQEGPNYNPDSNCFHDNVDTKVAVTSDPPNIDSYNQCGRTYPPASDPVLVSEVSCDSSLVANCPATPVENYPRAGNIVLTMPPAQPTMPNPCAGVPPNAWCSGSVSSARACVSSARSVHVHAHVASGERLVHFSARILGRHGRKFKARGGVVKINLAGLPRGRYRVRFTERVRVGGRIETFHFTRVYRVCAARRQRPRRHRASHRTGPRFTG